MKTPIKSINPYGKKLSDLCGVLVQDGEMKISDAYMPNAISPDANKGASK